MDKKYLKIGKFSGKGATAVICFCLAAVAALGVYSYSKSAEELKQELSGEKNSSAVIQDEDSPANANADDVPVEDAYDSKEDITLENDAFGGSEPAAEPTEGGLPDNGAEAPLPVESYGLTGACVIPLDGTIINEYSGGELVKSKTLGVWKTHDGIDISGEMGESVRSMYEGIVQSVENDPLMGITVVIDHGCGYVGYYSNLGAEVNVTEGEQVSAGTVIGAVGQTADSEISEDPHVHFALKKNGSWTDPAEVLSGEGS
ncbi:MAG: peptidoglycan DD-metalloendopeptidase family protein [Huintestinicola sp.]